MNISGIRPVSGTYTNTQETFGAYDVSNLHKPEGSEIKVGKVTSVHSISQVEKAVSTMKKDALLHKYQKFVGDVVMASRPGRGVMENFAL